MSTIKYLMPLICISFVSALAVANAKPERIYSIHELEMMKPPEDKKGVLVHAMGQGFFPEGAALLDENCDARCSDIVKVLVPANIEAQTEASAFSQNLMRARAQSKGHRFYVVLRVDTHYIRHTNGWTPLASVTVAKIISQSFDLDAHWRKLHSQKRK